MRNSFAFYVSVFRRRFSLFCNEQFQNEGLTQGLHFFILYVGKNPQCTQKDIVDTLMLDHGYATRSIKNLVKEGYLLQTVAENDHRARVLTLTEKGQKIFKMCYSLVHAWDEKALSCLTKSEQQTLFGLMNRIYDFTEHA